MKIRFTAGLAGMLVLVLAAGASASEQTGQIAHFPSAAAVSPALSSFSPSTFHGSPQDLTVHSRPAMPNVASSAVTDPVLQTHSGGAGSVAPKIGFGGIGQNGSIPPDPNIAVGANTIPDGLGGFTGYIVQMVNTEIAVFDKTGHTIMAPTSLNNLWSVLGGSCATQNAGDPVVQYDRAADRWLITQLGSLKSPYSECIAVSTSNDPTKTYFLYAYGFGNNLNDYPKFGIWPTATTNSAYLASYNLFANGSSFTGSELCAYDRSAMLAGSTSPVALCQTISNIGSFLPADLDGVGVLADGTPGYFLDFHSSTSLRLYTATIDFGTQTFTLSPQEITVASFSEACNGGNCIPQPSTNRKLDSLGDRLMYRLAYRVFPDHAAMVVNHSVATGTSVGVRWYELRQSAAASSQCIPNNWTNSTSFYLCQQSTYAPDSNYRWMGSAAMDGAGDIAIGYSTSSKSVYPAVRATYRCPNTALNTMDTERTLQAGNGSQTMYSRWGDYTSLRIDPADDTTFWYTNEYYTHTSWYNWSTWIGSFTVASCP